MNRTCLCKQPCAAHGLRDGYSRVICPKVRKAIHQRDKNRCQYCGEKLNRHNRTLDHVLPVNAGGLATVENLVLSCFVCNSKAGNREFRDLKQKKEWLIKQLGE